MLRVALFLTILIGSSTVLAWASPMTLAQLELDEGRKWVVDKALMGYLRTMESEIGNFQGQDADGYHRLGQRLKTQVNLLTSHCTMGGKAHDELHKWLVPYMQDLHSFSSENDIDALKVKYQGLRSSFDVFNSYFR